MTERLLNKCKCQATSTLDVSQEKNGYNFNDDTSILRCTLQSITFNHLGFNTHLTSYYNFDLHITLKFVNTIAILLHEFSTLMSIAYSVIGINDKVLWMLQIPIVANYHYRSMSKITSIFVDYYLNEHLQIQLSCSLKGTELAIHHNSCTSNLKCKTNCSARKHTTHSQLGFYYQSPLYSFLMNCFFKVYNVHKFVRPC